MVSSRMENSTGSYRLSRIATAQAARTAMVTRLRCSSTPVTIMHSMQK